MFYVKVKKHWKNNRPLSKSDHLDLNFTSFTWLRGLTDAHLLSGFVSIMSSSYVTSFSKDFWICFLVPSFAYAVVFSCFQRSLCLLWFFLACFILCVFAARVVVVVGPPRHFTYERCRKKGSWLSFYVYQFIILGSRLSFYPSLTFWNIVLSLSFYPAKMGARTPLGYLHAYV